MWEPQANEFVSDRPVILAEIRRRLKAEVLAGENLLDRTVVRVAATELMSRVLAHCRPGTLLLTSLVNVQVINTAEVASLGGVVFLEGRRPDQAVIDRARRLMIPVLLTGHSTYTACAELFGWGESGP